MVILQNVDRFFSFQLPMDIIHLRSLLIGIFQIIDTYLLRMRSSFGNILFLLFSFFAFPSMRPFLHLLLCGIFFNFLRLTGGEKNLYLFDKCLFQTQKFLFLLIYLMIEPSRLKFFFCPGVQKSCERDEGHYIINNSELEYSSFTVEGGVLMSDIWVVRLALLS